jgi:hypothetical protein
MSITMWTLKSHVSPEERVNTQEPFALPVRCSGMGMELGRIRLSRILRRKVRFSSNAL